MLIASARLALATSDTWEVAAVGCRPDDNARGLLQFGHPPTEPDCLLGLALPDDGPAPVLSTDPWLGLGARFSLDIDRGLAKALWASNFPSDDREVLEGIYFSAEPLSDSRRPVPLLVLSIVEFCLQMLYLSSIVGGLQAFLEIRQSEGDLLRRQDEGEVVHVLRPD